MSSHPPADTTSRPPGHIGFKIPLIVALVLVTILALLGLGRCSGDKTKEEGKETSSSNSTVTKTVQQPQGTLCPAFGPDGANCDIGPEGTAWIRKAPGVSSEARYCWNTADFRLIQYLDGNGQTKTFDAAQPPADAIAYRFYPKVAMTLDYNSADACRS